MEVKQNDDFDTLNLFVKKTKSEMIIQNYKSFGWTLISENENNHYEDIVDLRFQRPHKIKNKDEIQLMQVYLEDKLNAMGKLERTKTAKTTSFGLFFGIIGLIMVVLGTLFGLNLLWGVSLNASIAMITVGIIFLFLTFIVIPKLHKKETANFDFCYSILEKEVNEICQKASSLLRGENDE